MKILFFNFQPHSFGLFVLLLSGIIISTGNNHCKRIESHNITS